LTIAKISQFAGREELLVLSDANIDEDEDDEEIAGDRSLVDNGEYMDDLLLRRPINRIDPRR